MKEKSSLFATAALVFAFAVFSGVTAKGQSGVVYRNPYRSVDWEAVNQYLANFHCHTVKSDGRAEPDQLIYNYAEAGYHILAIADHDNYHTTREGERHVPPTAETTWPWTDYIAEEPAYIWTRNGEETSAFFPQLGQQGMLAIRANELTTHPHIVSLFNNCGWLESGAQCDDERLGCVSENNGLAYYAHPVDYVPGGRWESVLFEPDWDNALDYFGGFITKYNVCLGFEMQLGNRRELEEKLLNKLLARHYRDYPVFIKGSDDSHSTRVGQNATLTIVLAEALTEEAVRSALIRGHNFVGQRNDSYPVFNRITVNEDSREIVLDIDNYDRIHWIKDGERHTSGSSVFYGDMQDAILRFEVVLDGITFYSQAFYIR